MQCPPIVYGTAWKRERTEDLVRLALSRGFRGLDTAGQPKHYEEEAVGRGIAAALAAGLSRSELYLQTKFTPVSGQDLRRMPYDPALVPAQQVSRSFAASLENLRTSYVDAYVLHSPLANDAQTLEVWRAMELLVDAGKAVTLGISNCYATAQFEALCRGARIQPRVLQNRFHSQTGYDSGLRTLCRERDVVYQSFWTLTANPQLLAHASVASIARRRACTPAQAFFRYLTQSSVVPLTGTRSAEHMTQDLAIFEFELDETERAAITALLRSAADRR